MFDLADEIESRLDRITHVPCVEPIVQLATALSEWFPSSTTVDPDGVDQPAIAGVGGVILAVPDEGSVLARDGGTLDQP